jgi:hypothetical protein
MDDDSIAGTVRAPPATCRAVPGVHCRSAVHTPDAPNLRVLGKRTRRDCGCASCVPSQVPPDGVEAWATSAYECSLLDLQHQQGGFALRAAVLRTTLHSVRPTRYTDTPPQSSDTRDSEEPRRDGPARRRRSAIAHTCTVAVRRDV